LESQKISFRFLSAVKMQNAISFLQRLRNLFCKAKLNLREKNTTKRLPKIIWETPPVKPEEPEIVEPGAVFLA
jgi:hypothetical protein